MRVIRPNPGESSMRVIDRQTESEKQTDIGLVYTQSQYKALKFVATSIQEYLPKSVYTHAVDVEQINEVTLCQKVESQSDDR